MGPCGGSGLFHPPTVNDWLATYRRRDPAEGGRGRHADNRIRRGGGVEVNRATRGRNNQHGRRPGAPVRRLVLWPVWSLSRPRRPVASECFRRCRYLHHPLRLLPAGATVAGRGSHPLRTGAFSRRTQKYTVRAWRGRGVELDAEQPARPAQAPPRGDLVARRATTRLPPLPRRDFARCVGRRSRQRHTPWLCPTVDTPVAGPSAATRRRATRTRAQEPRPGEGPAPVSAGRLP